MGRVNAKKKKSNLFRDVVIFCYLTICSHLTQRENKTSSSLRIVALF